MRPEKNASFRRVLSRLSLLHFFAAAHAAAKNEKKTGILLIEHDMSVVMEISDHVVVLNYGKKIFQGSAKETKNSPEVIEAYLGTEE